MCLVLSVRFGQNRSGTLAVKGTSSQSHTSVSYTLWWLKCRCDILYDNQSPLPTLETTFRDQESFKCHRRSVLDMDPSTDQSASFKCHSLPLTVYDCSRVRYFMRVAIKYHWLHWFWHKLVPDQLTLYNFCPLIHVEQLKQCGEMADPLANWVVFQTSAH